MIKSLIKNVFKSFWRTNQKESSLISAYQRAWANHFKNIPLFVSDWCRATSFHDLRFWWFRKTWDRRIVTWPFSRSRIHFPFVRKCNIFIPRCRRTQSAFSCLLKIYFRYQKWTSGFTINPDLRIIGAWAWPIPGKHIQSKAFSRKILFRFLFGSCKSFPEIGLAHTTV